jgi:NADH-quinone oxidoreductase subunit G
MVNLSGRIQRLNRAVEPPANTRDDWEILRDLAGETQNLIEDVFKDIASTTQEFNGLSLSKIGHQGTSIIETGYQIPLLQNEGARKAAGIING